MRPLLPALLATLLCIALPTAIRAQEVAVILNNESPGSGWTWVITKSGDIWRVHHTNPTDSHFVGNVGTGDIAAAVTHESPGSGWAWILTGTGDVWAVHMDTPSDSHLMGSTGATDVAAVIDHESPGSGWSWVVTHGGDIWSVHMDTPAGSFLVGNIFGIGSVGVDSPDLSAWSKLKAAYR